MPPLSRHPLTLRSAAASLAVLLAHATLVPGAAAQTSGATAEASAPISGEESSPLDARLFYQLLLGEIELLAGDAGVAYGALLDAARRTNDEAMFRRATDVALQARAGDEALTAARAWSDALPESTQARRYTVQLLVALNRFPEAREPLREWLRLTPDAERSKLIATLPQLLASMAQPKGGAELLADALQPYAAAESTRMAVASALSRAWLTAREPQRAFDFAQQAHRLAPTEEVPVVLALQVMPQVPAAEALATDYLKTNPNAHSVRMVYARALTTSQRYADAIKQIEIVTRSQPQRATAWLTLGALQLELKHPAEAAAALETFLKLGVANPAGVSASAALSAAVSASASTGADADEDDGFNVSDQARAQAWLMLAQAAEQQGDYKRAESWLAKADNPQTHPDVQQRRASMLVRQGKVAEARALIRNLPAGDERTERAKFLAEAQLLREAKRWADARDVMAAANKRFPDDVDLMYEQSMIEERLNHLPAMETLLRRVIELKPDHHHAHNALGYSLAERNVRLDEARTLIRRALELAPGEPFITDSLGWVEFRLGNVDEALRLLRSAYQARPDTEIGAHLGEVLWVSGQRDEARRVLREARKRDAANDVLRETITRLRADL